VEDRRVVRVALSKLGKLRERQMREHTAIAMGEMLDRLTPQEQEQLIHLLEVMTRGSSGPLISQSDDHTTHRSLSHSIDAAVDK